MAGLGNPFKRTLLDQEPAASFAVIITTDQNIRYQPNISGWRIAVVVLMQTAWPLVHRQVEAIRHALDYIRPGEVREVHIPGRRER